MPKPTPEKAAAPVETRPPPKAFTVRDVRIIEHGNGVVETIEVVFRGVPSSTRTLSKSGREVAMQDVRLYQEYKLNPNRTGDSGLDPRWNGDLAHPDYE